MADNEKMYRDEAELQQIVYNRPDLLDPKRQSADIYSIAREVKLPSGGKIDVLCIDKDGTVILIEVKLYRNPAIRREVLAQIHDYFIGLKCLSYFDLDDLTHGKLETVINNGEFEKTIRRTIDNNLKNNGIRLIIVVDEFNDDLRERVLSLRDNFIIDVIEIKKGNDGKPYSSKMETDISRGRARTVSTGRKKKEKKAVERDEYLDEVDETEINVPEIPEMCRNKTFGPSDIKWVKPVSDGVTLSAYLPPDTRVVKNSDGVFFRLQLRPRFKPTLDQVPAGGLILLYQKLEKGIAKNKCFTHLVTPIGNKVTQIPQEGWPGRWVQVIAMTGNQIADSISFEDTMWRQAFAAFQGQQYIDLRFQAGRIWKIPDIQQLSNLQNEIWSRFKKWRI
jgi:hypothetical protein